MESQKHLRFALIGATLILAAAFSALAQSDEEIKGSYFPADPLPSELYDIENLQLETPQACVEHFVFSARQDQWRRAAAALDFRLHGEIDIERASRIAERFFYVLNQELWIDWSNLPDRPDGVIEGSAVGNADPMAGEVRRSILLGTIAVDGRDVPIHVHRIKPGSGDPIWLFSAHTVDNIEALWEAHGPSWLARQMPSWARERGLLRIPIWQWIGLLLTLILAPLIGTAVGKRLCGWFAERLPNRMGKLAAELEWPVAGVFSALLLWVMLEWVLGLPSAVAAVLEPLSLILLVMMVVWLVMRTIAFLIDRVIKDAIREDEDEDDTTKQRMLTKIVVARHAILFVVVLVGLAVILLHFGSLRTIGVTMLTSAGAMAVILGIAGHAVLGNLIAGLQIALAQPFRIGDTVYVENNWAKVEDITYVNVIVRTWDERRLIFPVGYFVSHWFENWSRTDPYLRQPIYLQVDYRADVDKIRKKFHEFVEEDEDWASDRDEPEVLVTGFSEETMTVRLTCGGPDVSASWRLVCRVREKLIAWLQQVEDGAYLPRRRLVMKSAEETSAGEAPVISEGDIGRAGDGGRGDVGDGDGDGGDGK